MRKIISSIVAAVVVAASLVGLQGAPASATPDHYVPKTGPAFNNPYGRTADVRRLIRQVNRTIDSVPRGGKIRISAWNVRSYHITSALLRAHRRNVSVQVVMDRINWNPNNPNEDAQRLKEGLRVGNAKRPAEKKSYLRRCLSACRGKHGIPHSKFFLFNKIRDKRGGQVRTVRWVTMYGSYNATELGATIQWNDLYTVKEQPERWQVFEDVFHEMAKDKTRKQGLVGYDDGVVNTFFYPYTGAGTELDPDLAVLDSISCTGAATPSGRTRIRIAQTAMYGDRGLVLARKLAQMKRAGCDIKIVYAMFGGEVLDILRAARIPLTHLAYDANEDGLYDRYVHMKTMAVKGNIAGDPAAAITWNGSANWTSVALASDEVVGVVRLKWVTQKYLKWIDYIFAHRPEAWGAQPSGNIPAPVGRRTIIDADIVPMTQARYHAMVEARAERRGVDPYALIKEEN